MIVVDLESHSWLVGFWRGDESRIAALRSTMTPHPTESWAGCVGCVVHAWVPQRLFIFKPDKIGGANQTGVMFHINFEGKQQFRHSKVSLRGRLPLL